MDESLSLRGGFDAGNGASRERGSYGYGLAVFVSQAGAAVFEVPGLYTKRHRKHSSHHGKSDTNDATAIAEVVLREAARL